MESSSSDRKRRSSTRILAKKATGESTRISRRQVFDHLKTCLGTDDTLIPQIPEALLRVQRAVEDDTVGARDLAVVIMDDPALTARLLKLANSAHYRLHRGKIKTITGAIVVLGFEAVRHMVLGMKVYNILGKLPRSPHYKQVWRHSLCVAVCAQHIARAAGIGTTEAAFVAGLLHDMGKLILHHYFPDPYARILEEVQGEGRPYRDAEIKQLQCSHLEAGGYIAEFWGFPEDLQEAIADHEFVRNRPHFRASETKLVRVVKLANQLALHLYETDLPQAMLSMQEIYTLSSRGLGVGREDIDAILRRLGRQVLDAANVVADDPDELELSRDYVGEGEIPDVAPSHEGEATHDEVPPAAAKPTRDRDKIEFLLLANEMAMCASDVLEFFHLTGLRLFAALGAEQFFVLLHDPLARCLEIKYGFGANMEALDQYDRVGLEAPDDVGAYVFMNNAPVVVEKGNLHRFSRLSDHNLTTLLGTHNLAAVPLHAGGQRLGVIVAARDKEAEEFDDEDVRILLDYARTVGFVIARTRFRPGGGND